MTSTNYNLGEATAALMWLRDFKLTHVTDAEHEIDDANHLEKNPGLAEKVEHAKHVLVATMFDNNGYPLQSSIDFVKRIGLEASQCRDPEDRNVRMIEFTIPAHRCNGASCDRFLTVSARTQ